MKLLCYFGFHRYAKCVVKRMEAAILYGHRCTGCGIYPPEQRDIGLPETH